MAPFRCFTAPLTPMSMMMASLARNPNNYRYATCVFNDTFSTVKGRADFRQFVSTETSTVLCSLRDGGKPVIVHRYYHIDIKP